MTIERGLAGWRTSGQQLGQPYFLALLAEAHGHAGQPRAGLDVLTEAFVSVDTLGLRMWASELYRSKGELLGRIADAPSGDAEASFRQAIEVARRQGARSLELRAALSLNELWRRQGRKDADRRLLAELYGCFTEGFDTADLRQARAWLRGGSKLPAR